MAVTEPPLIALRARTPAFPQDRAAAMAREIFGAEGTIRTLYGERDQNFHVGTADGSGIVMKIVGADEDPAVADFQTSALRHVAATDPGLAVPRVVPTRDGRSHVLVDGPGGARHIVRAVSFLPGVPLEGRPIPQALLGEIGGTVARLARALRGFFHPAAGQRIAWDPRQAAELRRHTGLIEPTGLRQLVERVLDRFMAALPGFATLRSQIIHNDGHPGNILVDEAAGAVVGLLDFGDMIHGPLVFDLAVPAAETVVEGMSEIDSAAALVAGYDMVQPLEAAEYPALYEAILARHAISLVIHAWRRRHDPEGAQKLANQSVAGAAALDRLMTEGAEAAVAALRAGAASRETTRHLVERRRRTLGPALELSYARPVHAVRGSGVWLWERDGRRLLDAYNNVPAVGHAHPEVAAAIAKQLARICSNTRYLHETVVNYVERLAATMPSGLDHCLFVNSGSEANDAAWRIAKAVTGRTGALVMSNAYHGITDAVAALSPYYGDQAGPIAPWVKPIEAPDVFRGRLRAGKPDLARRYAEDVDRAIAALAERGHALAAFIVDSAFVSNGIIDVPEGWLAAVAAKVRAAGGLVIGDEVQSGFGRCGDAFWGFARHGIVPDLVTLGKPMANGHPVGAVVTRAETLAAFASGVDFFSTFGGNPVSAAAALKTLEIIERDRLQQNAQATGALFRREIAALAARYEQIGEVRGSGLMIGVDIVASGRTPAPDEAKRIKNRMRELGVLIGTEGPHANVLKIRPPLPFAVEHVAVAVKALERALAG